MNRPKVLVADDDFDIRELLRFLLEIEGYEVLTAGNGFEALGMAVTDRPDLVVLDVIMPGENGYLVSRGIRAYTRAGQGSASRIPILLLTARDLRDDPDRERAFLEFSGADDVLYKPFDGAQVVRRVQELLGDRTQQATTFTSPSLRLTEVDLDSSDRRPASSLLPTAGAVWNPREMWHS
jgi:DNA-binding response OmpR family regulator